MELFKIKEIISEGKTEEAIQELIKYCSEENKYNSILNNIIIVSGEFKKYKRDVYWLNIKDEDNLYNKINYSLLKLIDELLSINSKENTTSQSIKLVDVSLDLSNTFYSQNGEITLLDYKLSSNFPILDFKLKNLSQNKILLYNFNVNIHAYEINPKPELTFFFEVYEDGNSKQEIEVNYDPDDFIRKRKDTYRLLIIKVRNNGWGNAINCEVHFNSDILKNFFSCERPSWNGSINSNEVKKIGQFEFKNGDGKFPDVEKEFKTIDIAYHCYDEKGGKHEGNSKAYLNLNQYNVTGRCYLTRRGITMGYIVTHGSLVKIAGMYLVIIKPDLIKKEYSISHVIGVDDFERFQIQIGAEHSCNVKVSFSFTIDNGEKISSDIMELKIKNPINLALHKEYSDGVRLAKKQDFWKLAGNDDTKNYFNK